MTGRAAVARGDVSIEVLIDGDGPPVVLLPSLGRGAEDFDAIAAQLAAAHFWCCGRSRAASAPVAVR